MKKILFVFPIIALLAASCNPHQNTSLNIQPISPIAQNTQSIPKPTVASTPIKQPQTTLPPQPTLQSEGVLAAADGSQIYTNQNIGIQMAVPNGWTLGKPMTKILLLFRITKPPQIITNKTRSLFKV